MVSGTIESIVGTPEVFTLDLGSFRTGNDPIPHWIQFDSALEMIRFRTGFNPIPHWNFSCG
jgi:hypothetical protein